MDGNCSTHTKVCQTQQQMQANQLYLVQLNKYNGRIVTDILPDSRFEQQQQYTMHPKSGGSGYFPIHTFHHTKVQVTET